MLKVKDIMTRKLITVSPQTEIARLMVDKKYHTLPVMEGDKIVGVVGKEDVLETLLA